MGPERLDANPYSRHGNTHDQDLGGSVLAFEKPFVLPALNNILLSLNYIFALPCFDFIDCCSQCQAKKTNYL